MNYFIINQKLPSLNEYVAACRKNPYVGAKFKKDIEYMIGWEIKRALLNKMLYKVSNPVILNIEWHEKTKKRDADNIASAKKFILDSLVNQQVIKDDSRQYVKGFNDIIIDDKSDFVKVELIEF